MTVEDTAIPADSQYYVERIAQWTKVSSSPYLQDGDGDYVAVTSGKSGHKDIGDWHFPTSAGSGTINSVNLSVRHRDSNPPDSWMAIGVSVDGGNTWTEYELPSVGMNTRWDDIDISTLINQDWTKLSNLRFYLRAYGFFTGSGTFYCYAVHRKTDYTTGGSQAAPTTLDGLTWLSLVRRSRQRFSVALRFLRFRKQRVSNLLP